MSQATESIASDLRSHLAVMTSSDVVTRALAVAGTTGDRTIEGLATTDGAVWIEVSSTPDTEEHVHLVLGGNDVTEAAPTCSSSCHERRPGPVPVIAGPGHRDA